MLIDQCVCCGHSGLTSTAVLWPELINAWRIAAYEVAYIDRQQGTACPRCGNNLRAMALAQAIMNLYGFVGYFSDFVESAPAQRLRILELNPAGQLSGYLARIPGHVLASYPGVDMMALPYVDHTFDLVLHSDTLEHVPQPVRGLAECHRVLRPNGFCAFTIPIIVDRLTLSRAGMPPSYHGNPAVSQADFVVHTEYGSDAWKHVVLAGFRECRIFAFEFPAAQALIAVKGASQ